MNKQKRDRWLKLVNKCMKQECYGNSESCSFCDDTKTLRMDDRDCRRCICTTYVIVHDINVDKMRILKKEPYHHACGNYAPEVTKGTGFWGIVATRDILNTMKEWLENQ